MSVANRTEEIALFPLGLFLLPGDYTQLHIFEERYKQLVSDCEMSNRGFGISFTNRLNAKNYGCVVEITEVVNRYPKGEVDIVVKAVSVFQLEEFHYQMSGKLYPGGVVRHLENLTNIQASAELSFKFKEYLADIDSPNSELLNRDNLGIFDIANELFLSDLEKLEFINLKSIGALDHYLVNYIRYLRLLQEQESSVYKNIYLN